MDDMSIRKKTNIRDLLEKGRCLQKNPVSTIGLCFWITCQIDRYTNLLFVLNLYFDRARPSLM